MIRFGKANEYEDILEMVKQIHTQHVNYRADIFKNIDIPMSKKEYLELINNNNIIVITKESKIIGCANILFRITKNPILCERKSLYIDSIIILKEFQNIGYGKKLLEFIKEYAKKELCDSIDLQVSIENTKAIEFYFANEFKEKEKKLELKLK